MRFALWASCSAGLRQRERRAETVLEEKRLHFNVIAPCGVFIPEEIRFDFWE